MDTSSTYFRANATSYLSKRESTSLLALLALAMLAFAARWLHGPIAQAASFHNFADQHTHLHLPNALDVLTNLPFAVAGAAGLWLLRKAKLGRSAYGGATTFFVGLIFTAGGSAIYHWAPNDMGLALDRLGMGIAFAGLLGWLAAEQISERAGHAALLGCTMFAPLSVLLWTTTQDLTAWAILQFGGMLAVVVMSAASGPLRRVGFSVIAWYAAAKLLETFDHQVYTLTQELI